MGRRIVMCNAYADLHMRNGDVIPMYLFGTELKEGDKPEDLTDVLLEQIRGELSADVEEETRTAGDFTPDPKTGAKRQVHRVVRLAAIDYAALRFDITEEERS